MGGRPSAEGPSRFPFLLPFRLVGKRGLEAGMWRWWPAARAPQERALPRGQAAAGVLPGRSRTGFGAEAVEGAHGPKEGAAAARTGRGRRGPRLLERRPLSWFPQKALAEGARGGPADCTSRASVAPSANRKPAGPVARGPCRPRPRSARRGGGPRALASLSPPWLSPRRSGLPPSRRDRPPRARSRTGGQRPAPVWEAS